MGETMRTTLFEDAQRHLEDAATAHEGDEQLYHIREARQILIAAEEVVDTERLLVQ